MSKSNKKANPLEKYDQKYEELKRVHGEDKVIMIAVPLDDENKEFAVGYIRKPERQVLAAAFSKMDTDPLGANELLLESCWIEGDERILKDDDIFLGAVGALEDLMTVRRGILKKK